MLFVVAVTFTAIPVEATVEATMCYTCTSSDPGGCPTTDDTGMTACSQSQDCYIFGAPCGKGW